VTLPHRDGHEGHASPRQHAAARKWKAARDRWAPHTEEQRMQDFDSAEQQNEDERFKHT
jgi:hypothetical protein